MKNILLVGNGPNYLSGDFSWQNAVRVAAQLFRRASEAEQLIKEPLPLVYEALVCGAPSEEGAVKVELARQMQKIRHNECHQELMGLGWRTVLTTNYDYCLEESSGEKFLPKNLAGESTYSLFRRRRSMGHDVWHIHGEVDGPRTMMLGIHQYAGHMQKLRQYLTKRENGSPLVFGEAGWEEGDSKHSWADLFLRDNVHIVGLGLDYSETVLWWLLSYKQRLRHLKKKGVSVGRTTYYQMGNFRSDRRLQVMEALGVKVELC